MPGEGAVVAIYGSWGLGKTSILNFVKYYLQKQGDSKVTVVNFNPWWFSGQEDLTIRFFGALKEAINKSDMGDVASLLLDFAELASEVNVPWWVKVSYRLVGQFKKRCIDKYALIDQKRKILEEALRKQNQKILITIDDIDRLTVEEIRQVFKLVKSVANLPNVIYLLAFDEPVVAKALGENQLLLGREYLKKIIQVPFELPCPSKDQIASLLFKHLDSLFTNVLKEERFDQNRWCSVFPRGIQYYINTPRDVIRLVNSLNVTYGCVQNEVNPVDFVAIETIRVFAPETYDLIRKNPTLFVGNTSNIQGSKFNLQLLPSEESEQNSPLKHILTDLFPKLKAVEYGSDWLSVWRKDLRICHPDCFPIYSRLTIPEGMTSNADIQYLLSLTKKPESLADFLIHQSEEKGVNGHTRLHGLLRRLTDHIGEDIQETDIPNLISAFFLAGDCLLNPKDQKQSFLDPFGSADSLWWIIRSLLNQLSQKQRLEVIQKSIVESNESISLIFLILNHLNQDLNQSTKVVQEDSSSLIPDKENLNSLYRLAIEKPLQTAKDSNLILSPLLPYVLWGWKEHTSGEDMTKWLDLIIEDDKKLLLLLRSFLQKSFVINPFTGFGHTPQSFPLDHFNNYVDPTKIIDRLKYLQSKDSLTEIDKHTVSFFIQAFNKKTSEHQKQG